MKKKFKILSTLLFIMFTCVACQEKVEMDDKCFVATIGIDAGDDIQDIDKLKEIKGNEPFQERQVKKFNITYGYPDMGQLGPGKSAVAETKTVSTQSYSMEHGISKATAKSSKEMYLSHAKLLLLSSEVISNMELAKEVVDYFERNPDLNRTMRVVIADGRCEDYIKFKPDMENNIEFYVDGLMKNAERNATIYNTDLNGVLVQLSENGDALIPRLVLDKNKKELVLKGVYVIKDYLVVGSLDEIETGDVNIIKGKVNGLTKVVYLDGHPVDFVIDGTSKKMKIEKIAKDKLDIKINVEVEGSICGYYYEEGKLLSDRIEELEDNMGKSLSKECEIIANHVQNNLKIDPFKIREHLTMFKPFLWKEIKDDWENVYSKSDINIEIKAKIRRVGSID